MVFPCKETSSDGELYFISSTHNGLRLRANVFGNVSTSKKWKGSEVWRFVDRGDGAFFISSWTHSQFYLSSFPTGRVSSAAADPCYSELLCWKLEKETNGTEHTVRICSMEHDRYLQLENGQLSTVEPSKVSNKCWWNLQAAHLDQYYLHCMGQNKQLGCPKSIDQAPFSTKSFGASEVWTLAKADQGFCIRSKVSGFYLRSTPDSSHHVTLVVEPQQQDWQLIHHPTDGYVMILNNGGALLACSDQGRLVMQQQDSASTECSSTKWILVPVMPDTTTRNQLFAKVGASAMAIALGMVTPSIVMGLLHSIGFSAHGILSGSMAAELMSRVAKAHGGSIPRDCWISTVQSIAVLGWKRTGLFFWSIALCGWIVYAFVFRLVLIVSGILDNKIHPLTSGIVASDNIGGILSTLDDDDDDSIIYYERREVERITSNHDPHVSAHPSPAPTISEIVVNHRNRSIMDALSVGSSSRFADVSSRRSGESNQFTESSSLMRRSVVLENEQVTSQ